MLGLFLFSFDNSNFFDHTIPMSYSYKGSISFGFVYIPINLYSAIKQNDIGFNLIDKKTMSRIKYKKTCAECDGREVKQEDIVKGFEYEPNKYVIFDDKDFDKIKSKKDKNISIEKFIDATDVDPIYFQKSYYVAPTGAEKAFAVLLYAMAELGKAAVAKSVLGNKESLILIRVKNGQMLLNTLFFEDEVVKNPAKEIKNDVSDAELQMAKMLVENMSGYFEPSDYKDEYRQKVMTAIEQKVAGQEIAVPKERENAVVDLMEALTKSLEVTKNKKTIKNKTKDSSLKAIGKKTKKTSVRNKKEVVEQKKRSRAI